MKGLRQGRRLQILFVHQNFPGQFVHLARALAVSGADVMALGMTPREVPGVRCFSYSVEPGLVGSRVRLARDAEAKIARATACGKAMLTLRERGVRPDVVVVHPGWGEAMFCKDVWPQARLLLYAEFFYGREGADYGFDPEFEDRTPEGRWAVEVKNLPLLQALHACDAAYAPTHWQRMQVPMPYRDKVRVVFDGIDTQAVRPARDAELAVPGLQQPLRAGQEVLTFVSRSLEPYRGFHVFMRALPRILRERPEAHCVIVGADGVSYGAMPAGARHWRERMLREVGEALPPGRVHFMGRVAYATYLKVLQVSRCHVYLTYPFVLSWSLIEAMSAGCNIVASDTAPVREAITHGREGTLVDFFDVQALGAAVVEVLGAAEGTVVSGSQARRTAQRRYDLAEGLAAQLRLVEDLAGQAGQAG
jgi:glycosyltransferase involved in cell wall biosynthesis